MNVKISVFLICVEAIIYLLLYNLYDCTFNSDIPTYAPTMGGYTLASRSIEQRLLTNHWLMKHP